jgi:ABC-type antimicrobial peptide transport system permease subunit
MINEAMEDALWPHEDPLGKCIRFEKPDAPCATIVGITQTALLDEVKEAPSPHMYLSLENAGTVDASAREVVLRVTPAAMTNTLSMVGNLLRDEFSGATVEMNTMAAAMEPEYRPWRLGATLFALFGALAAVVAAVGIYSSVSYGVSQRTHEFGVRAALGANAPSILRQVVAEGVGTVAIGVAAGILLAVAAGRLVASLLYGVSATNPFAMAIAGALLLAVAAVASLVPAWRAARVDPVTALRAD